MGKIVWYMCVGVSRFLDIRVQKIASSFTHAYSCNATFTFVFDMPECRLTLKRLPHVGLAVENRLRLAQLDVLTFSTGA